MLWGLQRRDLVSPIGADMIGLCVLLSSFCQRLQTSLLTRSLALTLSLTLRNLMYYHIRIAINSSRTFLYTMHRSFHMLYSPAHVHFADVVYMLWSCNMDTSLARHILFSFGVVDRVVAYS